MASLVRGDPAKVVFSHLLNCMLVEPMSGNISSEGLHAEETRAVSKIPVRIHSKLISLESALGAEGEHAAGRQVSDALSESGGQSTPKPGSMDRLGQESSAVFTAGPWRTAWAGGRASLRGGAVAFVPAAAQRAARPAPPGAAGEPSGPGTPSGSIERGAITTMMLRNLPHSWSRDRLTDLLDSKGFSRHYDFVYVPMNLQSMLSVGYAFVNFTSPEAAERFGKVFDGFIYCASSRDAFEVRLSEVQGLGANIRRYRNSPIMSAAVPDSQKPALFRDGEWVQFPAPTVRLGSLRLRRGKKVKGVEMSM